MGHDTDHLTPLLLESLLTLAVKFAIAPASTVAAVWESDTLMGGGAGLEAPPPQPARRIGKQYAKLAMGRLDLALIDFLQGSKTNKVDCEP
jgi:hypothetical protein